MRISTEILLRRFTSIIKLLDLRKRERERERERERSKKLIKRKKEKNKPLPVCHRMYIQTYTAKCVGTLRNFCFSINI